VDQWSSFRNQYTELHKTRARIPTRIPWFATSATLDAKTLSISLHGAGFQNPVVLRTTIDRPDIFYEFRPFEDQVSSFEDLRFLIPEKICLECALKLPKTIIYLKSSKLIRSGSRKLQNWLVEVGLTLAEARSIVQPFYANLSTKTKNKVADDFRMASSRVRIILATDAMGMGVGNEAVELVIQYGTDLIVTNDGAIKTVMQRLGRAARTMLERGHFIWLVPTWVFPLPDEDAPAPENSMDIFTIDEEDGTIDNDDIIISKKEAKKKRTAMTFTFQTLFDPDICIRETLLEFFQEPSPPNGIRAHRPQLCCNKSTCQPEHMWPSRQSKSVTERKKELYDLTSTQKIGDVSELMKLPSSSYPRGWRWVEGNFEDKLSKWRVAEAERRFGNSDYLMACPETIIPDKVMDKLVKMNVHCESVKVIHHFFPEWPDRFQYSVAIAAIAKESSFIIRSDGMEKNASMKAIKKQAAKEAALERETRKAQIKESYPWKFTPDANEVAEAAKATSMPESRQNKRKKEKGKGRAPDIISAKRPSSQRGDVSPVRVFDDEYGTDTGFDMLQTDDEFGNDAGLDMLQLSTRLQSQTVNPADDCPKERTKSETRETTPSSNPSLPIPISLPLSGPDFSVPSSRKQTRAQKAHRVGAPASPTAQSKSVELVDGNPKERPKGKREGKRKVHNQKCL